MRKAVILPSTHALLWTASDPKRLARRAHQAIRNPRQETGIAVATITLWEIAWLAHHQRILVAGSVESFVRETVARVILKPVTVEIEALALRLPEPFSQRSPRPPERFDGHGRGHAIGDRRCARIRRSKVLVTVW